jgi:hypothetical protein
MVMTFEPNRNEMFAVVHLVVPEAVPFVLLAALAQVIFVTPALSDAVPDNLILNDLVL